MRPVCGTVSTRNPDGSIAQTHSIGPRMSEATERKLVDLFGKLMFPEQPQEDEPDYMEQCQSGLLEQS